MLLRSTRIRIRCSDSIVVIVEFNKHHTKTSATWTFANAERIPIFYRIRILYLLTNLQMNGHSAMRAVPIKTV